MENQKSFIRRGKRVKDKTLMMECLEFEIGCDASLALTGDLKDDTELDAFLLAEAEKRGCRSCQLSARPPSWGDGDGVYDYDATSFQAKHIYTEATYTLTPDQRKNIKPCLQGAGSE